jgi:hypothetical protein
VADALSSTKVSTYGCRVEFDGLPWHHPSVTTTFGNEAEDGVWPPG